jgi:phosphatidylserine decarboxylase
LSSSQRAYLDRRSGELKTDPIYASAFLDWCYNTPSGILATRLVLSRRVVSHLYGWYYGRSWTRRKIAAFARAMGVDLSELTQPLESFASFSDFVSRSIDLTKRRIDPDSRACICPADGRVLAYQVLHADQSLQIKGGRFDLATFLRDDLLAKRYAGGAAVVVRLYLSDYHHFHFPASGIPGVPRAVAGRYFATTPYARRWAVPVFADNHRVITLLASDHFGQIAIAEVGAFTIGSVQERFIACERVQKGQHKGLFELGGSVVVLLFEPGAISIDSDLIENTRAGMETFVRFGERIGVSSLP